MKVVTSQNLIVFKAETKQDERCLRVLWNVFSTQLIMARGDEGDVQWLEQQACKILRVRPDCLIVEMKE